MPWRTVMVNQYDATEEMRNLGVPDDIKYLVNGIIGGIMALAQRVANANSETWTLVPIEEFGQLVVKVKGEIADSS